MTADEKSVLDRLRLADLDWETGPWLEIPPAEQPFSFVIAEHLADLGVCVQDGHRFRLWRLDP